MSVQETAENSANLMQDMQPVPFRITSMRAESAGAMTLTMRPEDSGISCSFLPGQFYMIYVFGHGEVPISVSGAMAVSDTLTFTVMPVGSVTQALCALRVGEMVGLRGPFGSSWPLTGAFKGKDILFMAGGLGLAPLRPAIRHVLAQPDDFGNATLLYGTRKPENVVFKSDLAQWSNQMQVDITVDNAGRDWQGKVGAITDLLKGRRFDPDKTIAMVCGPEVMMRFAAGALMDSGLPPAQIYISMERNMKCALGLCGRCQYGPYFICKDGPVFSFDRVGHLFKIREV